MCGINGVVYPLSGQPVDRELVIAMRDVQAYRGPDDKGLYEAPGVMLGSRRLAIQDLSPLGHMPMSTPDGRYWITYNGEVYNFKELRSSLEAKGWRFRSHSDTEVILYLYADEGPAMLSRLDGMYCIAIWDTQERTLFLARDHAGIKPVYYAERDGALYFASEQKALFAAGIRAEFDSSTWEELLCFRYVAGERTPFHGVRRLLPGHYLLWQDGGFRIHRWYNLSLRIQELRYNLPVDAAQWYRTAFDESVRYRLISDVPVGVLLSGGLDSGCVAASLGAQGVRDVASFTVRFKEEHYDEGPMAHRVADRWGLKFHELTLGEQEVFDLLHHCTWLNDEPLAHANDMHLYAISKYAKPLVSVLLSGEGADETLGGYVRYRPLRHLYKLPYAKPFLLAAAHFTPPGLVGSASSRLHKLARFLAMQGEDSFVLFDACDVLPVDLSVIGFQTGDDFLYRRQVLAEAKSLYPGEPMRQAMYLDQLSFLVSILDRNDRTTMGASIECRVPFLDQRLTEGLGALPSSTLLRGRKSKPLLRRALGSRLPSETLHYRKWGFGVPWAKYFQQNSEFREVIAALPNRAPVCDGPFDRSKIKKMIDAYLRGDLRHHAIVRQLVFIAAWHEACVAGVRPGMPNANSVSQA